MWGRCLSAEKAIKPLKIQFKSPKHMLSFTCSKAIWCTGLESFPVLLFESPALHHYTTSSSLDCRYKARGIHYLRLFVRNSECCSRIWDSSGNIFLNFCCPVLVFSAAIDHHKYILFLKFLLSIIITVCDPCCLATVKHFLAL